MSEDRLKSMTEPIFINLTGVCPSFYAFRSTACMFEYMEETKLSWSFSGTIKTNSILVSVSP